MQLDKELERRLVEVEQWRESIDRELESAGRQRKKLFAMFDAHTKASRESSEKMLKKLDNQDEKLDSIISRLNTVDERDDKQDTSIQKAEEERAEFRIMMTEEFKKKVPQAAGIVGFLGWLVSITIENLPVLTDSVIRIMEKI